MTIPETPNIASPFTKESVEDTLKRHRCTLDNLTNPVQMAAGRAFQLAMYTDCSLRPEDTLRRCTTAAEFLHQNRGPADYTYPGDAPPPCWVAERVIRQINRERAEGTVKNLERELATVKEERDAARRTARITTVAVIMGVIGTAAAYWYGARTAKREFLHLGLGSY